MLTPRPYQREAVEAVALASAGGVAETLSITVRSVAGEKYDQIVGHTLGPKPPRLQGGDLEGPEPEYAYVDDGTCPF